MFLPLIVGFLVSATLVTAIVTTVGLGAGAAEIAVPVAGVLLPALAIFELTSLRKTCVLRQTPRTLPQVFGSRLGGLAWGLDTGAMLTTFRTSSATYATLGLCLLGFGTAWSGVAYAFGFCVPLALAIYGYSPTPRTAGHDTAVPQLIERIAGDAHKIRWLTATLMVATAIAILLSR